MDIKSFKLNKFNITLVYEELSTDNFSLDKINNKFDKDVNIHKLNPELYIIAFNDGVQCQLGQRRVVANYNSNDNIITDEDVDKVKNRLSDILSTLSNVSLNAFGFNYDGIGEVNAEIEAGKYFANNFPLDKEKLDNSINGSFANLSPNFRIEEDSKEYNINLNANRNSNHFNFHFNVHFKLNTFLEKDKITKMFNNQYNKVINIINSI